MIKFTFSQSLGPKDSAHIIFRSGNYLFTVMRAVFTLHGIFLVLSSVPERERIKVDKKSYSTQ